MRFSGSLYFGGSLRFGVTLKLLHLEVRYALPRVVGSSHNGSQQIKIEPVLLNLMI